MTATNNLTIVLIIIFTIDLFLFFGQIAVDDMNPNAIETPHFYDYETSFLHDFDSGNYTINQTDPQLSFPEGEDSVSEEGTVFTDIFKSAKEWLLDTVGLRYLLNFLGAPVIFFGNLGLPPQILFGIGALWWGTTLFIIVAFILGRT